MNTSITPKPPKPSSTVPIRIKRPTAKHLSQLLAQLGKKPLGRAVTSDDVIAKALALLEEKHLEEIKLQTYSSENRLEIEFKNYCKVHGQISRNDFLGKILNAALKAGDQHE